MILKYINKGFNFLVAISVFFILIQNTFSQTVKPFTQRTSTVVTDPYTNKSIYNLRGDFAMIGNSNMKLSTDTSTNSNSNSDMLFVDIDGDTSTINSSSANLSFGSIQNPNCTEIIYAGLYWSGRGPIATDYAISGGTSTSSANISSGLFGTSGFSLSTSTTNSSNNNNHTVSYSITGNSETHIFDLVGDNGNSTELRYYLPGQSTYSTIGIVSTSNNGRVANLASPFIIRVNSTTFIRISQFSKRRDGNGTNQLSYQIVTNPKVIDKKQIKFKKEGGVYNTITTSNNEIYYPKNSYGDMYVGYSDVTSYVKANGVGNYFVADMALNEGNGSSIGNYGGWGMIVIYANPSLKWRDITIFDGYAFVESLSNNSATNYELALSGFKAAQNGDVNVTMGMMAGEGDSNISGDKFEIINAANSNWIELSHTSNSSNNFFNSSVNVGNTITRNPTLNNNLGLDIVKFNLPNSSKNIIANGQTSTKFRYGSTQDTYIIYNIVFAVDAYVPEAEGVNLPQQIFVPANGSNLAQTITNPSAVAARMDNLQPGDEVTMRMSLYNYGNENIKDARIDVNIPNAMRLVQSKVVNKSTPTHINTANNGGLNVVNYKHAFWIDPVTPNYTAPNPINPITNAVAVDGGVLRWDIGNIPTQILPAGATPIAMSYLEYTLKVTNDCSKLRTSNNECILKPEISGTITGSGVNSNTPLNPDFIVGYNTGCGNTPVYGNTNFTINPSDEFLAQCSELFVGDELYLEYFCSIPTGTTIPNNAIAQHFPTGTKFYYLKPTDPGFNPLNSITGDFNVALQPVIDSSTLQQIGEEVRYYAILPGTTNYACYNNIHVFVSRITSKPVVSVFEAVCYGQDYNLPVTLSAVGVSKNLNLVYFDSANATTPLASPPKPATVGTHNYWVAEASSGTNGQICYGEKVMFSINIKGCNIPVNPQIMNKHKRP